ncbi:MAG: hypothetical protein ABI183_07005 [Polyangiaceae bacterium]
MRFAAHGVGVAFFVTLSAVVRPASAEELRDLSARAKEAWARAGGEVANVAPMFIFEDETISVRIPVPQRPSASKCLTIAVIGARGLGIHGRFTYGPNHSDQPVASTAGVLEVSTCDGALPDRIDISAVSGRGAMEVVAAFSSSPLPSMRTIFSERTGGLIPSVPEPGALAPLASPSARADLAEARSRADSAAIADRKIFQSGPDGSGSLQVELDPGCHKIEVFGVDPRAGPGGGKVGRLDVDAELRNADDDTVLARDRSEAADARLEACVGGDTLGEIYFAGTTPHSEVVVTRAVWAIPEHLPRAFGRDPRARMAAALHARHAPNLIDEPVSLAQGPAGTTPVTLEVDAGACYLAVAAISHGTPRGIGLRAMAGGQIASDERGLNDDSGVVAFCARGERSAQIVVDARGTSLSWVLAVYRVALGAWGAK